MGKNLLVIEDNKTLLVKHSNKISEARYFLTVGEQRLILLMVSMIDRKDEDFKDYEIKINDFFKLLEIKNKDYKRVQVITKNLLSKVLEIEENNTLLQVHWLSSVKYLRNCGTVKLSFDPELKPYLLQLKSHFTKYNLKTIVHFRSAYTIRIYQILKANEYKGYVDFYYQELREILGIKEHEYPLYKHFKQRALDQAKKELEEKIHKKGGYKSDVSFNLEVLERKARKIHKIRFNIVKQAYQEPLPFDFKEEPEPTHKESPAFQALMVHGLSYTVAERYILEQGEEDILNTIKLYEEKIKKGKVKDKTGGYLIKLLNDKAGHKTEFEKQLEKAEKQAKLEAKKEAKEKAKAEQEQAEKAEQERQEIDNYFKNLGESGQAEIIKELETKFNSVERKFFKSKGLAHPAIMGRLRNLLREKIEKDK